PFVQHSQDAALTAAGYVGATCVPFFFFFSSRRRHTRSYGDWSSDVCSSDLVGKVPAREFPRSNSGSPDPSPCSAPQCHRTPRGANDSHATVEVESKKARVCRYPAGSRHQTAAGRSPFHKERCRGRICPSARLVVCPQSVRDTSRRVFPQEPWSSYHGWQAVPCQNPSASRGRPR